MLKNQQDNEEQGTEHQYRLYITGASPNSSRAVSNIRNILENCISGQYRLEIIDVYQEPQIAQSVDIIALPLLVRKYPLPEQRIIGDLSDANRVIQRLGLKAG